VRVGTHANIGVPQILKKQTDHSWLSEVSLLFSASTPKKYKASWTRTISGKGDGSRLPTICTPTEVTLLG
jgi:hypothetical protein